MKRCILLLVLLNAFLIKAQKWSISVNGGYSQATQAYQTIFDINPWKKNIHNLFYGLSAFYTFNEHWKISLSALLIEKGYKNQYTLIFDDIDSTNNLIQHIEIKDKIRYSLNFIEFPLTCHFALKKIGLGAGIFFCYKLAFSTYSSNQHQTYQYKGPNNYNIYCNNYLELGVSRAKEGYPLNLLGTNWDMGFNFNLGYWINKHLSANFYYSYGLKNAFNYNNTFYTSLGHQTVFLLGLSYNIIQF